MGDAVDQRSRPYRSPTMAPIPNPRNVRRGKVEGSEAVGAGRIGGVARDHATAVPSRGLAASKPLAAEADCPATAHANNILTTPDQHSILS